MHFLPDKIDAYIISNTENEPEILQQLTRETYQKVLQPIMLSGAYQGRVLSMFSKLLQPKSILEIGTFTGYGTLCLAEGLDKKGVLHTIDINEELVDFQRKYFDKSEYGSQIQQHLGNALEVIPTLNTTFDLIFIDADKENYINYYNAIIDKLQIGGVLIADNVLWHGKVIEPINEKDIATQTLVAFNALLKNDKRIEVVVLPIRDGLSISRKISD